MRQVLTKGNGSYGVKNAANIALIPESVRKSIFGERRYPHNKKLEELALSHLKDNNLYGKETSAIAEMPNITLPKLLGKDLDEHFDKIGQYMSQPYRDWCTKFISYTPQQFDHKIELRSGWIRYDNDGCRAVEFPNEQVIVFDVEVLYKISDYATMATAVSDEAWYVWLSPWILGESNKPEHLIPLGKHKQVVIGHNVSYDRKRVKEEYSLVESEKFFLDTMSLHVATAGMCARQRPTFAKYRKKAASSKRDSNVEPGDEEHADDIARNNPWLDAGTLNGVADVYAFNYPNSKLKIDKSVRDWFSSTDKSDVSCRLDDLIKYCALDVYCTKKIFDKVLPKFFELCPHPISFGSLKALGSLFLPINHRWEEYLKRSEQAYEIIREKTSTTLTELANELSSKADEKSVVEDPWFSQLDWTVKPPRITKSGKPVKNQKLPGKPEWYRSLFPAKDKPMNLSLRTRITPLLLKLQWDGNPLYYLPKFGWCFKTSRSKEAHFLSLNYTPADAPPDDIRDDDAMYFKIPHKDGSGANCGNPMAKGYLRYFENGILTSQNEKAVDMLKENNQVSYWVATRERAFSQMPVYQSSSVNMGYTNEGQNGIILPRFVPMGTVTRRAVENTWLTASNAKANRIGSELKAMITAPVGYSFIGADVDSEELWIASVVGDSLFGIHGGTALGWMTLEGSKSNSTDLHSRTANILGIKRDEAKIFNYGRIYGAGETFAAQLLKQFDPNISDNEATEAAKKLYQHTKGKKVRLKDSKSFWRGGSESVAFNQLELMAQQDHQRTPILGAGITSALLSGNLSKSNGYLTSRINWSIQSSGVDYLHLLIASMFYICKVYSIDARLMLTIHDEIRYMCKDKDTFRGALALQIANLWTRAMFCQQLGMDDLPQSVAFFSAVDIDHVLRKEVDLPCVTPSNPNAIEPGTALDIDELAEVCKSLGEPDQIVIDEFDALPHTPRMPIMSQIRCENSQEHLQSLVAQVTTHKSGASKLLVELENSSEAWIPTMKSNRSVRAF